MKLFRSDSDRGAALIEAALVLPILLLLTFGIWATARAWQVNNTLQHSAREAARYGATVDPWDPATSPGMVQGVATADLSSSSINPGIVTQCVELVAPAAASTCDPTYTNATSTEQVYVRLFIPDWELQFLFFTTDVDLTGVAIARFEGS